MINFSTNKQLGIILPHTNKALAEVLKSATPQQLEMIAQDKDLKSIITSLLQQSTKSSQSDSVLLELLKNNPTLKSLGNVSDNIKELLNTLKSDKNPLPAEKVLKNFLVDIKALSEPVLKRQIADSGIFLESKLKNVQNPQVELKSTLEALIKTLQNSEVPALKALSLPVKELLNNPALQNATTAAVAESPKQTPQSLEQLAKNVKTVLTKLQIHLNNADPITTKAFAATLSKLEHAIATNVLKSQNFNLPLLQQTLQQLTTPLVQSALFETKGMLNILEKILQTLDVIKQSSATPQAALEQLREKNLPQSVRSTLIEPLKVLIEKVDPAFSKESSALVTKLASLTSAEKLSPQHGVKEILAGDLKAVLLQAGDEVARSAHPNQVEILKHIDKLSLQIDYYQLMSHLSNASSLYVPFSWEQLEEGSITLKQNEEKFYCDIELKLKEYGELKLRLALYDKNQLNIHVFSNNALFRNLIKENIPALRSALIDSEITPREIRIFDEIKKSVPSPYNSGSNQLNMGFEVKV